MKAKHSFFIIFISCWNLIYPQIPIPLYKMVMNSDIVLIIESKDYQYITKPKNEYYTENEIKFLDIFNVLKNKYKYNTKNMKCRIETQNNDYYLNINGESCVGVGNILEKGKKYYNVFFLKKKDKDYFVIAHLWNNILSKDLFFFKKNINELNLISKERNIKKRYAKIQKWFGTSNENKNQYVVESPFTDELIAFFENDKKGK